MKLTAIDNVAVREVRFALAGAQFTAPVIVAGSEVGFTISTEGITTVTYFATDSSGNAEATRTLVVRIDKTPPEGVAQFDPLTKDVVVSGRDGGSGVPGGFLAPISVTPVKDQEGEKAERRTYRIVDDAGNNTILVAEVRGEPHEIKARIVSLQYNGGPVLSVARNTEKFEFALDRSGGIKELEQKVEVRASGGRQEVEAKFEAKKNQTAIKVEQPKPEQRIVRSGLVLLHVATDKGRLVIEF